ncbi:hypothetical protein BDW22DRAFT_1181550 [Trametopsis cervina]|nr:hypothetical protein BDW22DRAFT_1181550 [Trametopsis cervina]
MIGTCVDISTLGNASRCYQLKGRTDYYHILDVCKCATPACGIQTTPQNCCRRRWLRKVQATQHEITVLRNNPRSSSELCSDKYHDHRPQRVCINTLSLGGQMRGIKQPIARTTHRVSAGSLRLPRTAKVLSRTHFMHTMLRHVTVYTICRLLVIYGSTVK